MRQRPADGAEVANDRIGDLRRGVAQRAEVAAQVVGALARLVPDERADPEPAAAVAAEPVQVLDPVDVDQRAREP